MVRSSLGVNSALQLSGASICVQGHDAEINIGDYFKLKKMTYNLVSFEKLADMVAAYDEGRCDATPPTRPPSRRSA